MPLYHVNADDFDGSPHGNDLWVRARTPEEAVWYWQKYYGVTGENEAFPDSVDEVPRTPRQGAISWQNVPQVWARPREE